jgi:uncharacterized protein
MTDSDRIIEESNETINSLDGYYSILLSDAGIYLTVHHPLGNGQPVKDSTIVNDLQSREIKDYKYPLLIKTVREATGVPVKIAEVPLPVAEPEINVLVTRDRMEASLHIFLPQRCRPLLLEEVLDKISQSGVTYGLDMEAINKAFQRPGSKVTCARGEPPQNGNDGYIKQHIDLDNKGRPVELEDGRVDFKNLNMYTTVHKGELLAEKCPPTAGVDGKDVLGQVVSAKSGKDIPFPLGKNVIVENNTQIIAALAGQMFITNNKFHVIPVIEVNGDVDLSTGNIEFVGNIVIRGSVQSGFTVKAEGDIEIAGTVSGGIVEGNNITIRMGIQGMQRGHVRANGTVTTKFIENALVFAGNNVLVSDVILHSRVNAACKVIVAGRHGLIVGGQIAAGEEIQAKIVGTPVASSTDLQVGVNPMLRDEYAQIRKDLKKAEFNLDQTQKALGILRASNQATLSPDKREMFLKMTKANFHLAGQVDVLRSRNIEIEKTFTEMRNGRIRISDTVHPGVKIVVGTLIKPIRETMRFVSFYSEDGEIKSGSYK